MHAKQFGVLVLSVIGILLSTAHPCPGQQISEENVIKIVHNDQHIEPGASGVRLEFVRKYGGIEADDDEYILYTPRCLALDDAGNLYILDGEEPFVKVFDPQGRFVRSFGEKGEGPEEFSRPANLVIDFAGNLLIMNRMPGYMTTLSQEGDYLNRTAFVWDAGCWPKIYPISDSSFIGGTSYGLRWARQGEIYNKPIIKIVKPQGHLIRGFGLPEPIKDATMAKTANAVDLALDGEGTLGVSFMFQNRIEKYDVANGSLLMRITRRLPYTATEDPGAIYEIKGGKINGATLKTINAFSCGIAIDYRNRIWVLTLSRQPEYKSQENDVQNFMRVQDHESNYMRLEIHTQQGILIEAIPLAESIRPVGKNLFIDGKRLFLFHDDNAAILEYLIVD